MKFTFLAAKRFVVHCLRLRNEFSRKKMSFIVHRLGQIENMRVKNRDFCVFGTWNTPHVDQI
jgi:hypothetical protein